MSNPLTDAAPLACEALAIPADQRESHTAAATRIFGSADEVLELSNGYAFRLPNEADMFMALATFVENERRCCPFFGFTLEIEPSGGPLWLRMTGGEGVKEFLQSFLWVESNPALLKQLVRAGGDAQAEALLAQLAPVVVGSLHKASPV